MQKFGTIKKRFSNAELSLIKENSRKSVRGNPLPIKSVYWYNCYRDILANNKHLFVIQNNNLKASDLFQFKQKLNKSEWGVLSIRNTLFTKAVIDQFGPESKIPLLVAGSCLITFTDHGKETLLSDLSSAMKGTRLAIVGGVTDGTFLIDEEYAKVEKMPPLPIQRQMLLGVLESPARSLVDLLQVNQKMLVSALRQHSESKVTKE